MKPGSLDGLVEKNRDSETVLPKIQDSEKQELLKKNRLRDAYNSAEILNLNSNTIRHPYCERKAP